MNTALKYAGAASLIGALAIASAMPSQARDGRNAAAAVGFGAGALVGAAAAGAYYGPGYYGPGYGYAYEPAYAYAPGYAYDYAYAPGYAYDTGPGYYVTPGYYGRDVQRNCTVSPGSGRFSACN